MRKQHSPEFAAQKAAFVKDHMDECSRIFEKHMEMGDHRRPEAMQLITQARTQLRFSPKTVHIDIYMGLMRAWKKQKNKT